MKGTIDALWQDQMGEYKGKIRGEDGALYSFNKYGLGERYQSAGEFDVGEDVEFTAFTNKYGAACAKDVCRQGESAPEQNHPYGKMRKFVYLDYQTNDTLLRIWPEEIFGDCDDPDQRRKILFADIARRFDDLQPEAFVFSEDNGRDTLELRFGDVRGDGKELCLLCGMNPKAEETGVRWTCLDVALNGSVQESVFELVNANWYTLADDIQAISPAAEELSDDEIRTAIDRRCAEADAAMIWLKSGVPAAREEATTLYVPTGFREPSGKEVYLYCEKKRRGVRGPGWYYDCATYAYAPLDVYDKKDWLFMWADMFDDNTPEEFYRSLADQTLEETWTFEGGQPYGILINYLKYTFAHQWKQEGVIYSGDGKYAAFNTGLPDRNTYKYLYALLEKIEYPAGEEDASAALYYRPQYRLLGVTKAGAGGIGKILTARIHPLPPPPRYFGARTETVWELDYNDNNQVMTPEFDDTHILIQRCERLPLDFFRPAASISPKLMEILSAAETEETKYRRIKRFLMPVMKHNADKETTQVYRLLEESLDGKINTTIRKLSWNWRAVVPCYNPEQDSHCFLLPISLCDPDRPDRALIASVNRFGDDEYSYIIHTVVPLDWAYLDARLVCRPESEWLASSAIESSEL